MTTYTVAPDSWEIVIEAWMRTKRYIAKSHEDASKVVAWLESQGYDTEVYERWTVERQPLLLPLEAESLKQKPC